MNIVSSVTLASYMDFVQNEIRNARVQQLSTAPSSPIEGQFYWNSSTHLFYIYNGSAWVQFYPTTTTLDSITAPTSNVSLNSNKITNLATCTASTDAANKAYVDAGISGLSWKTAVRAATTTNGTLSSSFANGSVIDGVTLATNDRIALKNQTTQSDNGIYTVNASGAPTRSTDANTGALMLQAAFFVEEGTTNADTAWVCTNNATITLGSTNLTFVQFSGSSYTFSSGVQVSGSAVSANVDNTTIQVNGSNQLAIVSGSGGVARKFVGSITGNSSTSTFTITHNLNTKDVDVSVRGTSSPYTDTRVFTDVNPNNANSVDIVFATAPATSVNFSVTVIG